MTSTLLQWIDLFWLPVSILTMEKGKRLFTCCFVLACVFLLRLQIELLQKIGFGHGFFGLMRSDIQPRGLITYGLFILLFLLIARLSPGSDKNVHIAASIVIFMAGFCVSTFIMVL